MKITIKGFLPTVILVALILAMMQLSKNNELNSNMLSLWQPDYNSSSSITFHLAWWPRLITTFIAGSGLAVAGVLMQQVLRNPLASPSTLGVASGASFSLMLATLYAPWLLTWSYSLVALLGGLTSMGVVFMLSWRRKLSPTIVVISGLVINLYCAALSTVLLMMNQEKLGGLMVWGAGSLVQSGWSDVTYLLPRIVIATLIAFIFIKPLTLLQLSEQGAKSLGVSLAKLRFLCLSLAVIITAWVVSSVGIIGFVGLAAPAITRLLGIHRLAPKLIFSLLLGGLLLVITDLVIQQLPGSMAIFIPTGAATAALGAPLLLWLLPKLSMRTDTQSSSSLSVHGDTINHINKRSIIYALCALLIFLAVFSLFSMQIDGWQWLFISADWPLLQWRLPRLIAAALAGMLLAVAGTIVQRLSANPMASPEVIGVSSGTALGFIVAVIAGFGTDQLSLYVGGFLGAMLTLFIIILLNRRTGFQPERVLLTGVAISALMNAVQSFVLAGGDPRSYQILAWLSGSTYFVTQQSLPPLVMISIILMAITFICCRWLDLLPLGQATAKSLGLHVEKARILLLLLVAFLTVSATLVVGPLSFVGLMAPHIARMLGIRNARDHLISAAIIGAILMLFSDWIGRQWLYPQEVPAGIVASIIGGMYLMWGLRRL